MILVADSGSTKADWKLSDGISVQGEFSSQGFNPFFHDSAFVVSALKRNKGLSRISKQASKVFFYGAGCSSPKRNAVIKKGLGKFFSKAKIYVEHDLLGAVHATCGDQPGIACIIGTGSNACYFDGKEIHHHNHGLGYILGDECSGSYFGRKLVAHYLYRVLPPDIYKKFGKEFKLTKEGVLKSVYDKPDANVYLASFAKFLSANREHPFVTNMVRRGVHEFIETNIFSYSECRDVPVHFVGSIAFYFADILRRECAQAGIATGKIIQRPIDSLLEYHLNS